MGKFSFHSSKPAAYSAEGYEQSLFHLPAHLALQSPAGWHSFYMGDERNRAVVGEVHFFVDGPYATSPLKAPFGSFLFSDSLPPEVLFDFLLVTEEELKKLGAKKITLIHAPVHYNLSSASLLQPLLLNTGFSIERAELSTLLSITREPFENRIDAWEKRKLKQARNAELATRLIHTENLETVYRFIERCRVAKNFTLSMTWDEVQKTVAVFPDRFVLFGAFDQDNLVAAAIAVKVTHSVLYNFYSDHDARYDALSPVVMLLEAQYSYAQQQNHLWLDLGTSALDGKPNFPLLEFKMRLGGMPSPKYTFVKNP